MPRTLPLLCLALAGLALAPRCVAAADDLLFVRDGRVMLLPAKAETPVAVVAEDPDYTYALPTWADATSLLVVRYKRGKPGESQVGTLDKLDKLPVQPAAVEWMEGPAHLCGLGVRAGVDLMAFATLEPGENQNADLSLTLLSDKSHLGPPRHIATVTDALGRAPRRLRISPDGKRLTIPTFPSDVSATIGLYEVAPKEILSPDWLNDGWMSARKADATVSAAAWLPDGRMVLGTLTTGLYLYNEKAKAIRVLDTWELGKGSIREISVSADGQRVYYDVEGADGQPGSEIRVTTLDYVKHTVIRNAEQPDVRPSAG